MKSFKSSFVFVLLLLIVVLFIITKLLPDKKEHDTKPIRTSQEAADWQAPSIKDLPQNDSGNLIRYGRELITHTATYLGPKGKVASISNGMNCQNCHINGGSQLFANPFCAVASTYPKFRERSGRIESVEWRVNECMERSMNGKPLDTNSHEMKAFVAYLKWIGNKVPKGQKPKGTAVEELPYLNHAADVQKGKLIYSSKCKHCHGAEGEGIAIADSAIYLYPPLWGKNSFNTGAGMYRITRLAGFIKNNMPFGANYKATQLTNEESWDVAAFISSQPRPQKFFKYDWPKIATKPVDFPFGPYIDTFTERQHKYSPFGAIAKAKTLKN